MFIEIVLDVYPAVADLPPMPDERNALAQPAIALQFTGCDLEDRGNNLGLVKTCGGLDQNAVTASAVRISFIRAM